MANFNYTALDAKGEQTEGTVAAASEAEAVQNLRSKGLYTTQIFEEGKGKPAAGKKAVAKKSSAKGKGLNMSIGKAKTSIKPKVLMVFTRQLATLIDSGLPLLRSLTVLGKQEPNPALKTTIDALADSVQGGSTFSESLAQHPKIFNKLFVNMVKAGELGGVLEVVLNRLAEYQEKAQKLKNKIVSAMVYPAIVMFIAVAIMVFLMVVIVPKFKQMFADSDSELPLISQIVFGFSEFCLALTFGIPNVVWLFIVAAVAYAGFNAMGKSKGGRMIIDKLKLHLPIFGDIQRKSAVSRFARTLGTLVTSGVPILQALNITRDTAGNVVISEAISKVHEAVKEGESIVTPLSSSGVFPNMVISMVDVGEETGQLPEMLLKVADVYDDEVDNAVTALTSILEPIMIVVLALVVGAIVFALFLPLIKMITTMSEA
ncbi:MAG: type II secretion system F family protein [Akkermansiaceae bacterium]|jgi:type IV pilus assembly protein PilC|nr:type II secretion system F family protein [Akkermansiaceae bacterium]MDP4647830.1 type II secretion system F family protein [Akkermansiaceae bacterium]MDP4721192.1 type II secretion system F family protein [Akkermansiaceae bacterium]MDP4779074.1 type II secretion system F family protein [Akkermansiaceae bacterium]MDP4845932.1 type II secretion system F family protein [Akkermansiaceae bacterium]